MFQWYVSGGRPTVKAKLDNLASDIWKSAERLRGEFQAYEELEQLSLVASNIESQITTLTADRKLLIHESVTGQRRITEADLKRMLHSGSSEGLA